MSTFGQAVADLNRKGNIVEPHLAPAETSDVLVLYVPSNVDFADQERAINGILNANIGEREGSLRGQNIGWDQSGKSTVELSQSKRS